MPHSHARDGRVSKIRFRQSLRSRLGRRFADWSVGSVTWRIRLRSGMRWLAGHFGLRSVETGTPRQSEGAATQQLRGRTGETSERRETVATPTPHPTVAIIALLTRGCPRGVDACQGNQLLDGQPACVGSERRFVRRSFPPRTVHIGLSACARCGSCLRVV